MAENNFEELLGKNGELVEERKKQVLAGALDIIQRHYADKHNKMEAVAQLFGKNLGERFTVQFCEYRFDCLFTENGLAYAQPITREFDDELFVQMIRGKAVIADE